MEMSVGIAPLTSPRRALESWLEATMAARRGNGSAISVDRLHSIIVTWLFMSVLPGSRSDTGKAATRDSFGNAERSSRYRRKAPAHTAITTSLTFDSVAL